MDVVKLLRRLPEISTIMMDLCMMIKYTSVLERLCILHFLVIALYLTAWSIHDTSYVWFEFVVWGMYLHGKGVGRGDSPQCAIRQILAPRWSPLCYPAGCCGGFPWTPAGWSWRSPSSESTPNPRPWWAWAPWRRSPWWPWWCWCSRWCCNSSREVLSGWGPPASVESYARRVSFDACVFRWCEPPWDCFRHLRFPRPRSGAPEPSGSSSLIGCSYL